MPFQYEGQEYVMRHGAVVISAITSCTNTSNPTVMLGAGLLAKKAVEKAGVGIGLGRPTQRFSTQPKPRNLLKIEPNTQMILRS